MDDAVRRETAAVRTGVGILDGSTLGTIDVQGPDAGVFLDLIYTNLISSLKPGMVRYGVMCGVDGMVIDDGTVMRLEPDRFIVFTTTGGAAKILDWMEEWLQTEWPQLRVRLCSLTDHWATFPVVGPRSRSLIGSAVRRRRRQQRGVPVHGGARDVAGRGAGATRPGVVLRASWRTR